MPFERDGTYVAVRRLSTHERPSTAGISAVQLMAPSPLSDAANDLCALASRTCRRAEDAATVEHSPFGRSRCIGRTVQVMTIFMTILVAAGKRSSAAIG